MSQTRAGITFSWSEQKDMDATTEPVKDKPKKKPSRPARPTSLRLLSTTKNGRTMYKYLCSDICGHRTVWCYNQQGAKATLFYHLKVAH